MHLFQWAAGAQPGKLAGGRRPLVVLAPRREGSACVMSGYAHPPILLAAPLSHKFHSTILPASPQSSITHKLAYTGVPCRWQLEVREFEPAAADHSLGVWQPLTPDPSMPCGPSRRTGMSCSERSWRNASRPPALPGAFRLSRPAWGGRCILWPWWLVATPLSLCQTNP